MNEAIAPAEDNSLLENQVAELYRNANLANLAISAIAIFLAGILWPVADPIVLLSWCGYTLAITLARTIITPLFNKSKILSPNPKFWLTLYSTGVFLSGLGWGAVILFVVPVEASFHLVSAIFVVSGLVTASAGSMASLKHGFAIFSIPALLPGALNLILLNQTDTALIGLFICGYLLFISMVALRLHEVILHSLRKQFESAKFVGEVQEIHEALIARYDALEKELELSKQIVLTLQATLEQKNVEQASNTSAAERRLKGGRYNVLLEKLHGGSWDYNLKTSEVRFSSQWLTMMGYKEDEVYRSMDFWASLLHPDDRTEVLANLHAHINGKKPEYFSSHRLKSRSGEWIWVFSRAQPVAWGTFGEVLNMVCVEIDIEDPEIHLAAKMTSVNFKASDWLHSEAMFIQRLQYALQTTSIEHIQHAFCQICVYSIDIPADENLQSGGNALAEQLANILIKECRHQEPVLELGNNSFVVLLESHSIEKALNKAAALQEVINSHQFSIGRERFSVNTYIGITPLFDSHRTISEIFEDAETACNIASSDTRDNIFVYQRGNVEFDSGTLEKRIFAKIRYILANKRLHLTAASLKPLANHASNPGKLFWLAATMPELKNFAFAVMDLHDSAETNSLATAFDLCAINMFHEWVLAQPKSHTEHQNVYIYDCKLISILDEEFTENIKQLFVDDSPAKYFLCMAIPEAVFIDHNAKVRLLIDALKPAGVKFALTDFGSVPFTFEYLKNLPVDYLKLHDSLIANIDTDKTSLLTIKYFNEIGNAMNFKTIAFGLDNTLQEAALNRAGTHFVRSSAPDTQSLNTNISSTANKPSLATGIDANPK